MGAKLYVGNLPYSVTEERLQQHFAQHGSVLSARIITDKFSGRSKGFGFVEMSSDQEAERATAALNGTDFEGRNIVVSEARPQQPRAPRPSGWGRQATTRQSLLNHPFNIFFSSSSFKIRSPSSCAFFSFGAGIGSDDNVGCVPAYIGRDTAPQRLDPPLCFDA